MGDFLKNLFNSAGGGIIGEIGNVVDKFVTTKEEMGEIEMQKQQLKLQLEALISTRLNEAAIQANAQYQIEVDDRKDARAMATANPMSANTLTGVGIAIICVTGFFALLVGMVFYEVPSRNERVLDILIGTLAGVFTTIISYYFGSSAGAKRSADTLREIATNK
jgi:hypothetical protein